MPIFEINSGNLKAKINTYGASLISFSNNKFNLIESNTREGLYAGSVLAPWPNRIKDGRYSLIMKYLIYQLMRKLRIMHFMD